jgi:peptidoglycan hydrolase CwlO-like protein
MTSKAQQSIDQLWEKYRTALSKLDHALDENEKLKSQLEIDFTMPKDIKELEKKIEEKMKEHGKE